MRIVNKNSLANLKPSTGKNITPDAIRTVQAASRTTIERARLLGISLPTYYKYCELYGISTTPPKKKSEHKLVKLRDSSEGKPPVKSKNPFRVKRPLDLILQNKYTDVPGSYVKKLLVKAGIKEDKCELCNIQQKRECDGKTPLILKFLDDNKNNYSIDNLQIVCFNCNFLYYDEWSLKKILERTAKKRMKCEVILKNEDGRATGSNQACNNNQKEIDSGTFGDLSEDTEILQTYREAGKEETPDPETSNGIGEID